MKVLIVLLCLVCLAASQIPQSRLKPRQVTKKSFAATSDFAFDLYKKLVSETDGSKNVFFSPLSVYIALGMLKAGAKSTTNLEMEKAMNWQKLVEGYGSNNGHEAIERLLSDVFAPLEKNNTLSVANKLWLQKYFCPTQCDNFINILKKSYKADMEELNFAIHAEKSREEINKWVAEKTNQKIKDLLPKGTVNALTRFVLTNAIYFKSNWKHAFDEKSTSQRSFSTYGVNEGEILKTVSTMYQTEQFRFSGFLPASRYEVLEMPYEGEKISMVVVVPKTREDFNNMEKTISSSDLNRMLKELYEFPPSKLDVQMPKFKVNTKLDLKGLLFKMGMREVFNPRTADLSGITGYRGMFVSNAIHKAYVNVDEKGTEAAAATGITIELTSLPFQFLVNRPFIFMIRHVETNTILFMGRVMDPTAE